MAGSGLIQLVAKGIQDVYLTSSPEVTFWKAAFRRYTNFAMESIEQTFSGTADFGKKVTAIVSRTGDLIYRAYLQVTLPAVQGADCGFSWVNEIGHALISQVDIDIGGQRIDRHYGEWLSIWSSLTLPTGKVIGYKQMIGSVQELTGNMPVLGINGTTQQPMATGGSFAAAANAYTPQHTLYVPLIFWFNEHPGLALPLIALAYHDIRINFEFRPFDQLYRGKTDQVPSLGDTTLYIDYIYLDADERRKFASFRHEYLISQLQFTGDETLNGSNNKIKLNFNHPVKEIVWVCQSDQCLQTNAPSGSTPENDVKSNAVLNHFNWTTSCLDGNGANPVASAKISLNGHDRFSQRLGSYFNLVQPYQHHTNVPSVGCCVYSFSLDPEEPQPSGTLNFSRIDNGQLMLNVDNAIFNPPFPSVVGGVRAARVKVFAKNVNVLRITNGMGGLAYAS